MAALGGYAPALANCHRCIAQSNPAVIASPTQAVSASTTKSSSRACRPGTRSCSSSSTPIITTAMAMVTQAVLPVGEPEGEPHQNERKCMLLAVLAEMECGRKPGGLRVAKVTAAAMHQANSLRIVVISSG